MKLIGQGTYGCVFYPGIRCSSKSKKMVSKVVRAKASSETEIAIGAIVKTISRYEDYYAPILESCTLDLAAIKKEEIAKCDVVTKNPDMNFLTTSIRYVGSENVGEYLERSFRQDRAGFLGKVIRTHYYLLTALTKLTGENLVHFDLKENNIIMDEKLQVPIVIDFGLSFQMKNFTLEEWRHNFYDFYEKYPPWCLDVTIISFLVKEHTLTTTVNEESVEHMGGIIDTHFSQSSVMRFMPPKQKKRKNAWHKIVAGFKNRKVLSIVNEWKEYWASWDTYSVCVLFLFLLQKPGLTKPEEEYVTLLQTYILSEPKKRWSTEIVKAKLMKL